MKRNMRKTQKVYLVGAGAGGPGLITVKGREILRQADVVIYDYLVDRKLLEEAREGAELICCDTLGKKREANGFRDAQTKINDLIVQKAREGKRVVRLKGGDPFIFSRGSSEVEVLIQNGIEFEIVPGVTAAQVASCVAGVPLTDRRFSSSVVFVTGHEDPTKRKSAIDWRSIARCGTIVLYMSVENIHKISQALITAGKPQDTPVIAVSHAGGICQKIAKATLKTLPEVVEKEGITPPAVFIIGKVAALEKRVNWFRENRRILFTGLSDERAFIQGTYLHLPLIKIEPMPDYAAFDQHLKDVRQFDWIVFTSRYGVEYFFQRLKRLGYDARALSSIRIAAIGNSTQRHLEKHGVLADLVPEEESSEGLLKELKKIDLRDKKVFLPRSDISDKGLTEEIKKLQARVISCDAYRNVMPADLPDIDVTSFDEVMFTSPSGVRNFLKRYGHLPKKVKARFIGKVTQNEALRCHLAG